MTREQYLSIRDLPLDLLYTYYIERCTRNCLSRINFDAIMNIYPDINWAYLSVTQRCDQEFEVTLIQDIKTGKILKAF